MSNLNRENTSKNDVFRRRIMKLLERAIGVLPEKRRVVFVIRDVEGLSTEETAECLGISEEAVKTRLHMARSSLRKKLSVSAWVSLKDLYPFGGERCDRIVAEVMKRINSVSRNSSY